MNPSVSIVIASYNAREHLKKYLPYVLKVNYPNFEVIVSDDGSTDNTFTYISQKFQRHKNFKVVRNEINSGPGVARNLGARNSDGKYIIFLDNDTIPDPDFIRPLVKTMEKDPSIGSCQCKLVLMDNPAKIDYAGEFLSPLGFLVQPAISAVDDEKDFRESFEILSAKSAGMVISRKAFMDSGGFDPDFFMFFEESDLGWRVWLAGYRVIFLPESKVHHKFGTSEKILGDKISYYAKYMGCRNYIQAIIKNMEVISLLKILPIHVILWIGMGILLFLKGKKKESVWIMQGILWDIKNIGKIIKKREAVQKNRKISDKDLFRRVMKHKNFSYFVSKFTWKGQIGHAKGWNR